MGTSDALYNCVKEGRESESGMKNVSGGHSVYVYTHAHTHTHTTSHTHTHTHTEAESKRLDAPGCIRRYIILHCWAPRSLDIARQKCNLSIVSPEALTCFVAHARPCLSSSASIPTVVIHSSFGSEVLSRGLCQ